MYYRDEIQNVYFISDAHVFLKSSGWIFCSFRARHCRTQFNSEREKRKYNAGNGRGYSWNNHTASCAREHRSKWVYYFVHSRFRWLHVCRFQRDERCRFSEQSCEPYGSGWCCKRVKRPLTLQRGYVIFDGINATGFVSGILSSQ